MSTKIFNGWRIKASSLDEAINTLKAPGKDLAGNYEESCLKTKISTALHILVRHLALELPGDASALTLADKEEDREEKLPQWLIFPEKVRGYYLCLAYNIEVEKFYNIEEYNYWNNTDKPDDMPSRRWNTRKKDWDRVFSSNVPNIDALTLNFVQPGMSYYLMDTHKREAVIKDLIDNYKPRADDFVVDKMLSGQSFNYSEVMRLMKKQFKTPEEEAQYNTYREEVNQHLPPSLTEDMLSESLSDVVARNKIRYEKKLLNHTLKDNLAKNTLKI